MLPPGAQDDGNHHDLGGASYFGDNGDPWFSETTGTQGFNGMVGPPVDPYGYTFGGMVLPGTSPPPATGGGGGGTTPPPSGGGGGGGGTTPPSGGGDTPAPAPPTNPQDQRCRVLQFAALDVVTNGCLTQEKGVYIAKGGVKINGLRLAGGEMRFDPKELKVKSTGPVDISVGATKLFQGALDWKMPKGNAFALGELDVGELGSKVFGFGLKVGDADIKLVRGAVEIHAASACPMSWAASAPGASCAPTTSPASTSASCTAASPGQARPARARRRRARLRPRSGRLGGHAEAQPTRRGSSLKASVGIGDEMIEPRRRVRPARARLRARSVLGGVADRDPRRCRVSPLTLRGGVTLGAGPPLKEIGSDRSSRSTAT